MKTRTALAAGIAATSLMAASAASAAVIIVEGNLPGSLDTILLNDDDDGTDNEVLGLSNDGWTVKLTGNEDIIPSGGGGQAWLTGTDGALTYLDVSTPNATFTAAEININAPNKFVWSITLWGYDVNGTAFTQYVNKDLEEWPDDVVDIGDLSNNHFFNFRATDGDKFTHVSFEVSGDVAVGQVRLGAVSAVPVPEPSAWAMMIMGFGGIGAFMRRRRMALA